MDKTIHLTFADNVKQSFDKFLNKLDKEHPDVMGQWLNELAVDILRSEGISIERIVNPIGLPFYLMKMTHQYPGTQLHFVLYPGETDFPAYGVQRLDPTSPRYPSLIAQIKGQLVACAGLYAQSNGYIDYVIQVSDDNLFGELPHIHLLVYKQHADSKPSNTKTTTENSKKSNKSKSNRKQNDNVGAGGDLPLGASAN